MRIYYQALRAFNPAVSDQGWRQFFGLRVEEWAPLWRYDLWLKLSGHT